MIKKTFLLSSIAVVAFLSACSTMIHDEEKSAPLVVGKEKRDYDAIDPLRPAMFLRTYSADTSVRTQPVHGLRGVPLIQVIQGAVPGYNVIPTDASVDLYTPVTLSTGAMPLPLFLQTLSNLTGYDLQVSGRNIEASAFVSKEWILPMFSSQMDSSASVSGSSGSSSSGGDSSSGSSSGGSGSVSVSSGGSNSGSSGASGNGGSSGSRSLGTSLTNKIDDWDDIVKHTQDLLASDSGGLPTATMSNIDSTGSVTGLEKPRPGKAQVVANRGIGYIRVYGDAKKVHAVDEYLTGMMRQARKQVRLDVRSIEVSISNSRARGVNWNTAINSIFDGAKGLAGISLGADYMVSGSSGDGSLSIGGQASSVDDSVDALVNFLASYGHVEITNKPEVTVFNGRTAYIGSGEEFGYVASIDQTVSNGAVVAAPQLQRILIGVELSITPRVLDSNNILLEIVPVVSTLNGFDNFSIGGSQFSQPRIVLNQLSTLVVVPSGKPVHLGGLITSRINEATRGLPLKDGGFLSKVLGPVFSGDSNQIERRELILVVTPYLSNV